MLQQANEGFQVHMNDWKAIGINYSRNLCRLPEADPTTFPNDTRFEFIARNRGIGICNRETLKLCLV